MFSNSPLQKSCLLWDNVDKYCRVRQQITIWRMPLANRINRATNTHSDYATLTVFPFQQWLHERASLLPYTHISSLIKYQKTYTNLTVYTSLQYEMATNLTVLCPAKQVLWRKWGAEAWQDVFPVMTVKTGNSWCNKMARWFPVLCPCHVSMCLMLLNKCMHRAVLAWGTFIWRESLKRALSHSMAFCGLNYSWGFQLSGPN